jgi:hypothetical protein
MISPSTAWASRIMLSVTVLVLLVQGAYYGVVG